MAGNPANDVRVLVITHHAAEISAGGAIFLGDSIIELQRLRDLYYKVPIPRFIERYRVMVRAAAPARVLVVAIPGDFDEANSALRKMATEESRRFVEGFQIQGLTKGYVRFNAAGDERWRSKLRAVCTKRDLVVIPG